jgi:hypothetical protein
MSLRSQDQLGPDRSAAVLGKAGVVVTVPDTADDGHLHVYADDGYCVSCGHLQETKHREAMRVGAYDYWESADTMVSCTVHVEWEHVFKGDFTLTDLEAVVLAHVTEDQ